MVQWARLQAADSKGLAAFYVFMSYDGGYSMETTNNRSVILHHDLDTRGCL